MWWSSVAIVVAVACHATAQDLNDAYSPPSYPSPWMRGGNGWDDAYAKAQAFVSQLTLLEKINLTTGVGWEGESCVGNTGSIPRINFPGLCLQDSPLGVRDSRSLPLACDRNLTSGQPITILLSPPASMPRQRGALAFSRAVAMRWEQSTV